MDAKDVGSKEMVRSEANCGVGATNPEAIYIGLYCIDRTIVRGDVATTPGELPIRVSLIPHQFAGDLKEELSKVAPARILTDNEVPKTGWLVEGQFDLIDGGSPVGWAKRRRSICATRPNASSSSSAPTRTASARALRSRSARRREVR